MRNKENKINKVFLTIVFAILFARLSFSQEMGIQLHPKISLRGELETEFIDSQKDSDFVTSTATTTSDDNSIPRFQVDRLMLKPKITFSESLYLEGELEFLGDGTHTLLKEGYGVITFPSNIFLKVGLDDRFFINPEERKTEVYPLNGTAFWQDEDVGMVVGGDHALSKKTEWYWRTSLTNGLALREQGVGKNSVYFMLHDNREINDLTNKEKEYGMGVGLKSVAKKWDVMMFGVQSKLRHDMTQTQTATDIDFLKEVITGYTSDNRDNWFLGGQGSFTLGDISLFSQYIYSRDGEVTREGFYMEPSFQLITLSGTYLNSIELLYRYNVLDVHAEGLTDNISSSSFTWDRTTHSFAMNIQLTKYALLKNEYHWNLENTGGTPNEVANNEFISQLEIRF